MFLNIIKLPSRVGHLVRYGSTIKGSVNTIDPNEVSKFGKYMKIWWDPNGPMKQLMKLNHIRVPFIKDNLHNLGKLHSKFVNTSVPFKNLNILDAGCGGGILSEALAQLGANVTGIDASKELSQVAKLHSLENKKIENEILYIHAPLEDICDKYLNHFDVVVASEVIEHVSNKETFLKSCTDVLKPGGSIFLTTFNKTIISWLYGIIVLKDIIKEIPKGTHEWEKFVSPEEAAAILKDYNCDTRLVRGFIFSGNNWKWRKSNSINYALHALKED